MERKVKDCRRQAHSLDGQLGELDARRTELVDHITAASQACGEARQQEGALRAAVESALTDKHKVSPRGTLMPLLSLACMARTVTVISDDELVDEPKAWQLTRRDIARGLLWSLPGPSGRLQRQMPVDGQILEC